MYQTIISRCTGCKAILHGAFIPYPWSSLKRTCFTLLIATVFLTACDGVRLVSPYDEVIYNGLAEYKELLNKHVMDMADLGGTVEGTYEANKLKYNELETKIDLLIDRASLQSNGRGCSLGKTLSRQIEGILKDRVPPELSSGGQAASGDSFGCTEKLLILVKNQLKTVDENGELTGGIEWIHKEADTCPVRDKRIAAVVEIPNEEFTDVMPGEDNAEIGKLIDSSVDEVIDVLKETLRSKLTEKVNKAFIPKPGSQETVAEVPEVAGISCLREATSHDALAIANQSINAAWVVENAKKTGKE